MRGQSTFLIFLLFAIILYQTIIAQHNVTLSGYVKDAENGEALIGVNISMKKTQVNRMHAEHPFRLFS